MIIIKGRCCKLVKLIAADLSGLGRWNFIDLQNSDRKIGIVTAYQGVFFK